VREFSIWVLERVELFLFSWTFQIHAPEGFMPLKEEPIIEEEIVELEEEEQSVQIKSRTEKLQEMSR